MWARWWVSRFWAIQLIYYREISAILKTKDSKLYTQRRAPEREEEQDSIHQRRDSEAVSEIPWAFLGVVSGFPGFE